MILLSYMGPHHVGAAAWLAAFGAGSGSVGNVCTLFCPNVPTEDSAWQLRARPLEHACLPTAVLPVPCAPNHTHSELLQLVGDQAWSIGSQYSGIPGERPHTRTHTHARTHALEHRERGGERMCVIMY